jgi:hypothetical protein
MATKNNFIPHISAFILQAKWLKKNYAREKSELVRFRLK